MDSPSSAHLNLLLTVSLALSCMSVLRSAQPAWWRCQNGYRQLLWIYPWRCRPVQVTLRTLWIIGFSVATCCILFFSSTVSWVSTLCRYVQVVWFPLLPLFKLGEGAVIPLLQLDGNSTLQCIKKRREGAMLPFARIAFYTGSPVSVIHSCV